MLQHGTVILARSVSHQLLTGIFVVIALALMTFVTCFETTRKAQCQGVLLPTAGVIRIAPTQSGLITRVDVSEGQSVKAGDILFVLSGERSSNAVDSTQKAISNLLQNRRDSFNTELKQSNLQLRQRLEAIQHRIKDLATEIEHLGDQIELQQHRIALSEQGLKRFAELQATSYISMAQLQDKQSDVLDQRQRLADLRRIQATSARDMAAAQADLSDVRVQALREAGALKRNVSTIEQELAENEARREILVRAPHNGVVTAIATNIGQTVSAGTILASVLPSGSDLEAEIYAPSRSAGFIKPGMKVLLRYQAYPYQKFGQYAATVREVAGTAVSPKELAIPGAASATLSEPLYRIRLKLDKQTVLAYGNPMPLKSGMLVDASVMLEKRKLYEWMLEPLFSISGRM